MQDIFQIAAVVPSLASGCAMPAEDVVKVFKRFDKDAWQIGDVVGPQVAICCHPSPSDSFFWAVWSWGSDENDLVLGYPKFEKYRNIHL